MATINYTAPDGTKHKIPLPEGGDPTAVVAQFESSLNLPPETPLSEILPEFDDQKPISGSIAEEIKRRGRIEPLIGTNLPTTTQEEIQRGLALGGRTVVGAAPKFAAGVADLGSTILNLLPELISRGDVALGGEPLTARLPTDTTAGLEAFLDQIFPAPKGIAEKAVVEGGQLALTGGAGGAALATRAAGTGLPAASRTSLGSNILDEIGAFFAQSPKLAATGEIGGGLGTVTASELGEKADLGPTAQSIVTLLGGVLGGVAPVAGAAGATRAGRRAVESFLPGTKAGSELRAARAVQEASADPRGDVQRIRERPEDVLPGRATEDPNLQALEARVLKEDPRLGRRVEEGLETAENAALTRLADSFGPGSDKKVFQQEVILQGTPENASIKIGQPDEMLTEARVAFNTAYGEAEGFPVMITRTPTGEGLQRPVSVVETVTRAIQDPEILTTPAIQARVQQRIEGRLNKLVEGGETTTTAQGTEVVVDSKELLSLRSAIRTKQSTLAKAGALNPDAAEEAALLENVNQALTGVLEGQLPPDAVAALRATDARYGQFKIAENAINRSPTGDLTPENLRKALKASPRISPGQFARGETGELGRLAETGRDVAKFLGKPEEIKRIVRNMTPEQKQTVKADLRIAIAGKSTRLVKGETKLDGKKLLDNLNKNRETLLAAGVDETEIKGLQTIAKELRMIQRASGDTVTTLLTDNVSTVMRFIGALAGSESATRARRALGLTTQGPSLIIAGFGSRIMQNRLKNLSVDQADKLMRAAFSGETRTIDGKEVNLLEVLLLKPTAGLKKQADAAQILGAFLIEAAPDAKDE